MVAESGCGISIPPEDAQAIAGAVLKLMGWRKRNGRQWASGEGNMCWKSMTTESWPKSFWRKYDVRLVI